MTVWSYDYTSTSDVWRYIQTESLGVKRGEEMARPRTEVSTEPAFLDPRITQAMTARFLKRERNIHSLYKLHFRLIGCGGTGSKLMPELAQALALYMEGPTIGGRHDREVNLIVCDPDVVEVGNLNRQHFPPSDVGKNKARALAERYSAAYGLSIGYKDSFIDTGDDLSQFIWQGTQNGYPPSNSVYILITAVDNHATRKIIHKWFEDGRHRGHGVRPFFWIDMGNEEVNGYVTIGFLNSDEYNFALPIVTEIFPDILRDAGETRPSQLPCGAAGIQDLNVNAAAATHCMSFIRAMLKKLSMQETDERGNNRGFNLDSILNYYQIEFGVNPPTTMVKFNVPENLRNIRPIMEGSSNRRHFNVDHS